MNFNSLKEITRRRSFLVSALAVLGAGGVGGWLMNQFSKREVGPMIKRQFALGFQWATQEPFLFCVHHHDFYPKGNGEMAPPRELLSGRDIGQDFQVKDGFRMYHGSTVPGFPVHPHRGFETVTIVRKGYVDHSDSLGAAGRYGQGDVQWMTAGRGIQHSEMFPLIRKDADNTLELFQIWLNLPKASKMVEPHFTMMWSENIPQLEMQGGNVRLSLIAGTFDGRSANSPPPDSWASRNESEVAIWLVKVKPGASFEIPASKSEVSRTIYFFDGDGIKLQSENEVQTIAGKTGLELESRRPVTITAASSEIEFLMLQAKPLGEPVVQHGPFVMNSREEIMQTIQDYQATQFGGWPWARNDMVHGDKLERFAKYPDGRVEKPKA